MCDWQTFSEKTIFSTNNIKHNAWIKKNKNKIFKTLAWPTVLRLIKENRLSRRTKQHSLRPDKEQIVQPTHLGARQIASS